MIPFEMRAQIPETSNEWQRLAEEVPKGADLLTASLVLTNRRASVLLTYQGYKPDGTAHKRTSTQEVTIASHIGDVRTFVKSAMGKSFAEKISPLL